MADERAELGFLHLQQIVDWLALPPRMQLMKEGLDPSAELYRKLATRLASGHLGAVGLMLAQQGPDLYQVEPRPGADWPDVAYYLGHMANLQAGRLVVNHPDELLAKDVLTGEPRAYADHRQAVLAQLNILAVPPENRADNPLAQALRAAVEAALEVEKLRRHAA